MLCKYYTGPFFLKLIRSKCSCVQLYSLTHIIQECIWFQKKVNNKLAQRGQSLTLFWPGEKIPPTLTFMSITSKLIEHFFNFLERIPQIFKFLAFQQCKNHKNRPRIKASVNFLKCQFQPNFMQISEIPISQC